MLLRVFCSTRRCLPRSIPFFLCRLSYSCDVQPETSNKIDPVISCLAKTSKNNNKHTQKIQTWFCSFRSILVAPLQYFDAAGPTISHHFSSVNNQREISRSSASSESRRSLAVNSFLLSFCVSVRMSVCLKQGEGFLARGKQLVPRCGD